ncbi:hypothetical protein IW261DRAFT_1553379 [Armillaria novae-zelandiae]|uniref:Uncharacterized protein n=1 Tax=Armillaria novae-zelandiae TaxID=153914 RepID=A0AA39T8V9_9AGAR|nr:hypothetical protein IW261DRAFT_1553379 [Armillaria novae-zelandiae]
MVLIGYLPAGNRGVEILCADGQTRLVHPILATYVADYPEQCLVRCCMENCCLKCLAKADKLGDLKVSLPHNQKETIQILKQASEGLDPEEFTDWGLCPVNLFWADLPYCNIFLCFTPDILHQLHKGAFKDHLKSEVNHCFQAMTCHPSLQHFKKGISLVSQWTGNEYKNMEKTFLSVIAGCADSNVTTCIWAVLDFIYYAHYEEHTTESLQKLEEAWCTFHDHKAVFIEQGIHEHFNIPKIHSIAHYASTIHSHGYIKQITAWMSKHKADQKEDNEEGAEVEVDDDNVYIDGSQTGHDHGSKARVNHTINNDNTHSNSNDIAAPLAFGESVYSIPKVPAYTNVTIDHLQVKFKASEFVYAMETFLHEHKLLKPDYWDAMPAIYLVYKQF